MGTMALPQPDLFAEDSLPGGLVYRPEAMTAGQEKELAAFIAGLPLKPFEFVGGFTGNRRVVSFGWRYDFNKARLEEANDIPPELELLREQVVTKFQRDPARFQQVLVTEYDKGAGIGWHKDRPQFSEIIGVSLLEPCNFRLRRKQGTKWQRASFTAEPRSAYLLSGVVRSEWEHSIPPMEKLRYSVTFRSLKT